MMRPKKPGLQSSPPPRLANSTNATLQPHKTLVIEQTIVNEKPYLAPTRKIQSVVVLWVLQLRLKLYKCRHLLRPKQQRAADRSTDRPDINSTS